MKRILLSLILLGNFIFAQNISGVILEDYDKTEIVNIVHYLEIAINKNNTMLFDYLFGENQHNVQNISDDINIEIESINVGKNNAEVKITLKYSDVKKDSTEISGTIILEKGKGWKIKQFDALSKFKTSSESLSTTTTSAVSKATTTITGTMDDFETITLHESEDLLIPLE